MSFKDDVKILIEKYSRRLQKLKEQAAIKGIDTSPEILTEIEDIEAKLAQLLIQLKETETSTQLEELQAKLQQVQALLDKIAPKPVPFNNQKDILRLILSSLAPPYYLLDAPAGYGKTELLLELRNHFRENGWVCPYVSADEHGTLQALIEALFSALNLGNSMRRGDARRLGFELGGLLRQNCREEITKQGLVFLIDLGKTPPPTLVSGLLKQFIPSIQNALRVDKFFQSNHNRFRVVLAGRYLAGHEETATESLRLNVLQLSPFSYEILYSTAREYLADCAEDAVIQISAHIMHISGGHPGCMAHLLEMYRRQGGPPPDDFLELYKDVIEEIINQEIDRVEDSIPDELRGVMTSLGIFRYLNSRILERLIDKGCISGYSDVFSLIDKLTGAYLLGREGRILRNNNTHRLLALRLRQQVDCAASAQEFCEDYLSEPKAQLPELWVIEALYQYLQHCAQEIDSSKKRLELRQTFLEQVVPGVLRKFVRHRQAREEYEALKEALKKDQEIRFTVNYYLRENQYNNDEVFNELQHQIDRFFAGGKK